MLLLPVHLLRRAVAAPIASLPSRRAGSRRIRNPGPLALLLGLLAALPLQAQTLADVLESAWVRHPAAAAFAARDDEARAGAEIAAGWTPGPAAVSLANLNDSLDRDRGQDEWELEFAVPLWLPGQRAASTAEATHVAAALAARRAALRLQVAGDLREAWWAVAGARSARDLAQRRLEAARALDAEVRRRVAAGDLAPVDGRLAQGERLAAEGELLDTEVALSQAEQAYRTLTGEAAPATLAEEAEAAPLREDHPQRIAAATAAQVARARLTVARQTRRDHPELALRLVRERGDRSEPYGDAVGVKVTFPLASGPRLRQASAAVQAELAEADAELALAERELGLAAEQARLALDSAERRHALAQERRALTAANLQLAERAFALGESDLATLLRAQASAFEAESLAERQHIVRAAARSRLNQALGVLP